MNWIERCNQWRRNYDSMSYEDHMQFYKEYGEAFPEQVGFNEDAVIEFLAHNFRKDIKISVLELGGWRGELADKMLKMFTNHIPLWFNYEICTVAKYNQVCKDPRYHCIIPRDFIWELDMQDLYSTFICANTIEHLSFQHLWKLLRKLDTLPSLRYIYIQSPLPVQKETSWDNFQGPHKLDAAWPETHFMLGKLGWKEIRYNPGSGIYTGVKV